MKRILSLTLVLVLCLISLTVYAAPDESFVIDNARLMSADEVDALNTKLQSISRKHNAQIVVMTIDSLEYVSIDEYIEYVYDDTGYGYGSNRDGVLLLVCMNPREYRILTNGMADSAIGPSGIDSIGNVIVSDLSNGYYSDAFNSFADECNYYLDGHVNGFPFDVSGNIVLALGIGIVVGIVVAFILKGQLKSVRKQNQANVYVRPGSMKLTTSNDLFLYRTVNRRRKQNNSSGRSGSSGSSRSVGGGRF